MSVVLTLLVGVAGAWDPADVARELPRNPAAVLGCRDLTAAFSWFGDDAMGLEQIDAISLPRGLTRAADATAYGLDPAGPLAVAFTADAAHARVLLPVSDENLFRSRLVPELVRGSRAAPGVPDTWLGEDGTPTVLEIAGDVAELRVGHWTEGPATAETLTALLARLNPTLGGCWAAADLLTLDAGSTQDVSAEAVLLQGTADGSHYEAVLTGVDLPDDVHAALVGAPAPRKPLGRSTAPPELVLRINGDALEAVASVQELSMLLGRGLPPVVGSGGALLSQSSLQVVPGVELALSGLLGGGEPSATLVLPVARPRGKRRLAATVERAFEDAGLTPVTLGDAWSLDGVGDLDGWWLGVTRGALVLSTDAPQVQAVVDRFGEPWVPEESLALASVAGVWVRADLTGLPIGLPVVATAHIGSPAPGELAVSLSAPGLVAAMEEQLPGLVGDRAGGRDRPAVVPPDQDPVGVPPSTEALSVLMTIASLEAAAQASTGAFVAYDGGPRPIEDLDGAEVDWDGIPALGLGPMAVACRYEVRVDHEGWLATSWCDDDADGEPAVQLLRPGGTPITVSPPRVR